MFNRKLSERIRALETRLDALETHPKVLRNEWEDVLDRMNRVMGRLNARLKRAEKDEPEDGKAPVSPERPVGTHAILEAYRGRRRGLLPR